MRTGTRIQRRWVVGCGRRGSDLCRAVAQAHPVPVGGVHHLAERVPALTKTVGRVWDGFCDARHNYAYCWHYYDFRGRRRTLAY